MAEIEYPSISQIAAVSESAERLLDGQTAYTNWTKNVEGDNIFAKLFRRTYHLYSNGELEPYPEQDDVALTYRDFLDKNHNGCGLEIDFLRRQQDDPSRNLIIDVADAGEIYVETVSGKDSDVPHSAAYTPYRSMGVDLSTGQAVDLLAKAFSGTTDKLDDIQDVTIDYLARQVQKRHLTEPERHGMEPYDVESGLRIGSNLLSLLLAEGSLDAYVEYAKALRPNADFRVTKNFFVVLDGDQPVMELQRRFNYSGQAPKRVVEALLFYDDNSVRLEAYKEINGERQGEVLRMAPVDKVVEYQGYLESCLDAEG